MRILYSSNLPQEPFSDIEIAVDKLPVVEEAFFTVVTNKKGKSKERPSSSTNTLALFQNMLLPAIVVLRALPSPQLTKIATAKPIPAKMTTTPKMSKQIPKSFVQVVYSKNSQPTPRFALVSAYPEYKSLLCFHGIFLDLSIEKVLAMHQSEFGTSASNRGGAIYFSALKASKIMIHRPIRHQVLIPFNASTTEVIIANAGTTVEFCNRGLVEAHSKLRVELVCKVQNGVSISTNFVVSAIELEVIKQQFKKVASLTANIVVESHLPQSKLFLKILGVFYQSNNSFLPITQA